MFRTRWINKLISRPYASGRGRQATQTRKPVRLRLEALEERVTPDATSCVSGNVALSFYGHGHSPEFNIPVTVHDITKGGTVDSGSVTCSLVNGNSKITLGSATIGKHGDCNVHVDLGKLPDNLSIGSFHLEEDYHGNPHFDSCSGSGTLTINALTTSIVPTTVAFNCSSTSTVSSLTISTQVKCSSDTVSGGTVTFDLVAGNQTIHLGTATVGANGVAKLTVTDHTILQELASLKPGHYHLVEHFSGSGHFAGCSDTTTVTVNPEPTTIVVSPNVNITVNNNTTYNITVNVNSPSGPVTSGTVTIDLVNGNQTIHLGTGTIGPNGTVKVTLNGTTLSSLPPGQYQLVINFNAGSGTPNGDQTITSLLNLLPQLGSNATTSTSIPTALSPGNGGSTSLGGPTTIPVLVNGPSGPVSEGTVTITLLGPGGSMVIGSSPISGGSAAVPVTVPAGLAPGFYSMLESYTDSNGKYLGSNGTGTLTVQPLNPVQAALQLAIEAALLSNLGNPGSVSELQMFSQVFLHQPVPTSIPELLSDIRSLLPQTGSMLLPALAFAEYLDADLPIENPM